MTTPAPRPEREQIVAEATRGFLAVRPPELAETVRAAAIPHWFDAPLLAALLALPPDEAGRRYAALQEMPFVQAVGDRGHALHELTRRLLLDELWAERPADFRAWSRRAADYFDGQTDDTARIEAIYHWLVADPGRGADLFWEWDAEWSNTFRYNLVYALVQAGLEHDAAGRLAGRAKGWLYYSKGTLHSLYSENREALESLRISSEAAVDDRPLEANCIKSLGDVHVRLAEYPQARQRYEEAWPIYQAIGNRLGAANCISSLGDVSLAEEDYEAARVAFEEAASRYHELGARNDEASAFSRLADIFSNQQRYREAADVLSRAIELMPDYAMWYRNRANDYINAKDFAAAAADLARAAELQPDHPYLTLRRGDLAFKQGQYDEAAGHYRQGLAALPNPNSGHFGLGLALICLGQETEGLAEARRALALTYAPREIREFAEELEKLIAARPERSGLAEALALVRAWQPAKQAST
ncbi:MAG: tetratricopeptide repeat protein [Chloroflexi bacterium]|nr:tetratricopeptide repeat protein [Chloroflexota bacterium]